MTTLADWNILTIFEAVKDVRALEITRRVIQAEVLYHEARLGELKALDEALGSHISELQKG
jgi:hypothetical protein